MNLGRKWFKVGISESSKKKPLVFKTFKWARESTSSSKNYLLAWEFSLFSLCSTFPHYPVSSPRKVHVSGTPRLSSVLWSMYNCLCESVQSCVWLCVGMCLRCYDSAVKGMDGWVYSPSSVSRNNQVKRIFLDFVLRRRHKLMEPLN